MDVLAIPADAPHPENAHRLIDYLLRPDVLAKVTESDGLRKRQPVVGAAQLPPSCATTRWSILTPPRCRVCT